METSAAILTRLRQPLQVAQIEIPALRRGQVRLRMLAAGLCRTQINEIGGQKGPDRFLPHLLGHEGVGRVEKIGPGVRKVKPGDKVAVTWLKGKGLEGGPVRYDWKRRRVNAGPVALFSERAVVSENRLVPIPSTIPDAVAAIVGCAVSTGAGLVRHFVAAPSVTSLAIFGAGGVGLSAIMMAQALHVRDIAVVDISRSALELAKKMGASVCINSNQRNPVAALQRLYSGGPDVCVDASGIPSVMEQAFQAAAGQGLCVFAGHPAQGSTIRLDPFAFISGKRLVGTWGGETQPDRDIPYYLRLWQQRRLLIHKLVTATYPLEDIQEAVDRLQSGHAGRIVITFT